jgi:hypothetical protein
MAVIGSDDDRIWRRGSARIGEVISAKAFDASTDIAITAIGKDLVAFMPTP